MFHLRYAILRKTPVSPKALKWILQAQALLNEKVPWSHDRLSFAPLGGGTERPPLAFPFIRVAPSRIGPYSVDESRSDESPARIPQAVAMGSMKTRSLWESHLVAALLARASEMYPEMTLELRDDSGQFVIAGAITIQGGKFALQRDFLQKERERLLEMTGDPAAVAGLDWAEAQALYNGAFLIDGPVADFMEIPEASALKLDKEMLATMTVGELANHYVGSVLSEMAPVAA